MGPHEAVAIAEIVAYAPVLPLTLYLFWRNAAVRPRMAWFPLITFTLFRLASGIIVVILTGQPDNVGLIIAALVCLNVGLIPLLFATVGLLRKCVMDSFPDTSHRLYQAIKITRILLVVAIGLLSAGGGTTNSNGSSTVSLPVIGYIILLAVTVFLAWLQLYLRMRSSTLTSISRIIITYSILATPFLLVRAIYGLLYAVNSHDLFSFWSPLYGNATVFAVMALAMEYIALWLYIAIGLLIPASHWGTRAGSSESGAVELRTKSSGRSGREESV